MTAYYLRLRSARVIGSIGPLPVSSFNSAKALAKAWVEELGRKNWSVEVTNESGETLWTM